jgi:hypothetical protein
MISLHITVLGIIVLVTRIPRLGWDFGLKIEDSSHGMGPSEDLLLLQLQLELITVGNWIPNKIYMIYMREKDQFPLGTGSVVRFFFPLFLSLRRVPTMMRNLL